MDLTPASLKLRTVKFIDIAESEKGKKMYEKANDDPRAFKSTRTGRGPLLPGWQKTSKPIMCAYKLVRYAFFVFATALRALSLKLNSLARRQIRIRLLAAWG